MDLGIIIARLLQIGIGAIMIFAVEYRKRNLSDSSNPKFWYNRHPKLWKASTFIVLLWGWSLIIWCTYQLYLI